MGNVEALKALYVAMGGAEEDVANLTLNSEVIAALANVAAAVAANVLPEVTGADDGKVLTVVDGKWAAV
jgi:hypothetical protein